MRRLRLTLALALVMAGALAPVAAPRPGIGVPVTLAPPVDAPWQLAANFAELRPAHFHGGLDFKTERCVNRPVYAATDGYIARVTVSPGGYGKALYIRHPLAGITTVYGHLNSFLPEIDAIVAEAMTDGKADVEFVPWEHPVSRGAQVALSGNTGHSMGPHLHFEVRDHLLGLNLDPLEWYAPLFADTTPPALHGVALFDADGRILARADGEGCTVEAWGEVYPAFRANDYADDADNRLGVKYARLFVDGALFWIRTLDDYPLAATSYIDTLVPEPPRRSLGQWWEWTRTDEASQGLPLSLVMAGGRQGALVVDREADYHLLYELADHYGNTTRYAFVVRGRRP